MAESAPIPKSVYLIDGHHRWYKAYYAVSGLTTPNGEPINAVYGFVGSLLKLLRTKQPTYWVVAFDRPGKTFRHEKFTAYKAHRPEPPDDMKAQWPLLMRVLQALQVPMISHEGFEADDILGTLALKWASPQNRVYLATGDKDAKQCIGPYVSVYDMDSDTILDATGLKQTMGLTPTQVIDWLALVGDASDNVPGVPSVGEKTALPLIQRYGTLENVLANADRLVTDDTLKIRGKAALAEKLKTHAEQARLSKWLVTLDCAVPLPDTTLEHYAVKPLDRALVLPVFQDFGFTTFIRDWHLIAAEDPAVVAQRYHLIESLEALDAWLKKHAAAKQLGLFVLWEGARALDGEWLGVALHAQGESVYLPFISRKKSQLFDADHSTELDLTAVLQRLRPVLESPQITKAVYDDKSLRELLIGRGIRLVEPVFDVLLAAYLLNPTQADLSLPRLALEYTARRLTPRDLLMEGDGARAKSKPKSKSALTLAHVPIGELKNYACQRAEACSSLQAAFEPRLTSHGLMPLFAEIETPLSAVLARMEMRGVTVDLSSLKALEDELTAELAKREADVFAAAGKSFNIRSPKQVADVLFLDRGYEPIDGTSTDEEVLHTLAEQHPTDPLPQAILDYRELHKLLTSYVATLPSHVRTKTGRVHTSFVQWGTATGRLSSTDPNLQNIPIRSPFGKRIRSMFVAGEGNELIVLDYSQIELRLLAHLSGDPTLMAAFINDQDVHRFVAAKVSKVEPEQVTEAMRGAAKAVNFGIIYGQTAFGLSANLKIPQTEARQFIDDYFATFPVVRQYIDEVIAQAHQRGFVTTMRGRRRYLPDLRSSNRVKRQRAEREAINTVVQGSAADLIKIAMVELQRRIDEEQRPLDLLLQIHDELVLECPAAEAYEQGMFAKAVMEGAMQLSVPLKVSWSHGRRWEK